MPPAMPDKIGVIAGSGSLPARVLEACDKKGIQVFVVALEGQADPASTKGRQFMRARIGRAGEIVRTLQAHGITDLVLIGSLRRPSLSELRPDLKTAAFFARLGLRALGDDDLLRALRAELEADGFRLWGAHHFAEDLLVPAGPVGACRPKKSDHSTIAHGFKVAGTLGALDIGQSVAVQQGYVLGVEATEGTDALIARCGTYRRKGRGPVLVKICKPGQDPDLDMPAIGPGTVRSAVEAGFSGIVAQAGRTLLVDAQQVARIADENGLFVIGADPSEFQDREE